MPGGSLCSMGSAFVAESVLFEQFSVSVRKNGPPGAAVTESHNIDLAVSACQLGMPAVAVFSSAVTGITLGLNLWNALVVGVLGLPGLVLLLLTQWVLR